jgi:drug/metabolite transporter (DMT)-like permease
VTAGEPAATHRRLGVPAATAMIVFSVCCFGSISIVATVATRSGAVLLALLTWRYVGALASLAMIAGRTIVAPANRARAWPVVILGGGIQALIAFTTLASLEYISAATLGFLFYTYPAWVVVIAAIRRTERLTAARLGALALSLMGIILMVGTPAADPIPIPGLLLALGAALLYAIYIPLINNLQRGVHPAAATAYISLGAALAYLGIGAATGGLGALVLPTPTAWLMAAILAIVCTTFAFITFLRALPVLGPVRTAIVSTVEPFYTAVAGAVLLGQPLRIETIAGGVLIAAAVLLIQRSG